MGSKRVQFTKEQILSALAAAPSRISELTLGLTEAQLHAAPSPGEWSVNEVLAHLRSCADVWGGCIQTILNQDKPTIRAIDPRTWIKRTDYRELGFQGSLLAYTVQRTNLLAELQRLKPQGWVRTATVTGAGAPLVRTVQFYAQWLARHERPHLKQIKTTAEVMRTKR
jgi:hypothetical protein